MISIPRRFSSLVPSALRAATWPNLVIAAFFSVTGPAVAEDIGPGSAPISAADAANLFGGICAKNHADHAKAKAAAEEQSFVPSPETGTYYDSRRDVSFKFLPDEDGKAICSMVFGSQDEAQSVVLFPVMAAGVENVSFDPDDLIAMGTLPVGAQVFAEKGAYQSDTSKNTIYHVYITIPASP